MLTQAQQSLLSDCILDMGELLIDCGAEIARVEDTLTRMGQAYGAEKTEVFVITSLISLTIEFPDSESVTETRRITSSGSTDFYRLEKLNALSRSCCASPLPLEELREKLRHVSRGKKPEEMILGGSALAAGSFAVFFGGNLQDGTVAAVFGLGIALLQGILGRTRVNTVAANLLLSLLTGLGVGMAAIMIPTLQMDKILIGDIMLLIPGLAMTNAVRNMLVGDTISGVVRLAESLIWAAALAGGFMVSFLILDLLR
ncbi:MAG: threonine/serine exporter family protein [Oscillospiraceae bacterium]|nr:threonine/serine exporter family protein [Oscillospiraceae bacterium]